MVDEGKLEKSNGDYLFGTEVNRLGKAPAFISIGSFPPISSGTGRNAVFNETLGNFLEAGSILIGSGLSNPSHLTIDWIGSKVDAITNFAFVLSGTESMFVLGLVGSTQKTNFFGNTQLIIGSTNSFKCFTHTNAYNVTGELDSHTDSAAGANPPRDFVSRRSRTDFNPGSPFVIFFGSNKLEAGSLVFEMVSIQANRGVI